MLMWCFLSFSGPPSLFWGGKSMMGRKHAGKLFPFVFRLHLHFFLIWTPPDTCPLCEPQVPKKVMYPVQLEFFYLFKGIFLLFSFHFISSSFLIWIFFIFNPSQPRYPCWLKAKRCLLFKLDLCFNLLKFIDHIFGNVDGNCYQKREREAWAQRCTQPQPRRVSK